MDRIATGILLVIAVAFATGLAYFILVPGARSEGVLSVLFWYVGPGLTVLLCVWGLFSTAERRLAIVLFLSSVFVSSLLAEAALRVWPTTVPGFAIPETVADSLCPGEWKGQAGCLAAAERGLPFDTRTTLQVMDDYREHGIEAWPSIDASHHTEPANALEINGVPVVPLAPGVSDVTTIFCNESGAWVTYEADEHGFNNPMGSHDPDGVDVAVVGDSYVHGWCVPYDQTVVGRLRKRFPGALSVGIEGSGPWVQLGIVREYLLPVRPTVVVWAFYEGNDLRDFVREASNERLRRYLEPDFSQGLATRQPEIDAALRAEVLELKAEAEQAAARSRQSRAMARSRRNSLAGWIRLTELRSRLNSLGDERFPGHPFEAEQFVQVAAGLKDAVESWGGTLLFAYVPSRRRFAEPATANPHKPAILEAIQNLEVPAIDLTTALSEHPDPLALFPFRVENHLTAEGYDLMACTLMEFIETHLPPGS
jgi:hypothetical protein